MEKHYSSTTKSTIKEEHNQLLIILLIVFIGFVGTSVAYPIFPPLFLHAGNASIVPAYWQESARSILLGIALASYPLGQFIGLPILGGCSDSYGRKLLLIISLIGSAGGYLLSALALHFNWLWVLIFSRFLTGLMEGNLAIVRAMASELGTISRYKSLGRINSVAAIGYVMGPLLGGFLSDIRISRWFSFAFPFYLAVILSLLAVILAVWKLQETKPQQDIISVSIWQRFNLFGRLKLLFKSSSSLKSLLLVSTIFTFSVDIFYEFGPVYLTGLWSMTPAGIAIYNAALSITLAIGSGWLPQFLSLYFPVNRVISACMFLTAFIFGLMSVLPHQLFAFILFALVGLTIATVNTNITIQVSNLADKLVQGEAMGAQLGLRMLGDAVICLVGGFIIVSSVLLPIIGSFLIALIATVCYGLKFKSKQS